MLSQNNKRVFIILISLVFLPFLQAKFHIADSLFVKSNNSNAIFVKSGTKVFGLNLVYKKSTDNQSPKQINIGTLYVIEGTVVNGFNDTVKVTKSQKRKKSVSKTEHLEINLYQTKKTKKTKKVEKKPVLNSPNIKVVNKKIINDLSFPVNYILNNNGKNSRIVLTKQLKIRINNEFYLSFIKWQNDKDKKREKNRIISLRLRLKHTQRPPPHSI